MNGLVSVAKMLKFRVCLIALFTKCVDNWGLIMLTYSCLLLVSYSLTLGNMFHVNAILITNAAYRYNYKTNAVYKLHYKLSHLYQLE